MNRTGCGWLVVWGVGTVLCVASASLGADTVVEVLEQIRQAQGRVRTVRCRVVTELAGAVDRPHGGGGAVPAKRVTLEIPDKYRIVTERPSGDHAVTVRHGPDEWKQSSARNVYHTLNGSPGSVLLCAPVVYLPEGRGGPNRFSTEPHLDNVLRRPEFEGVQEINGQPCYVLAVGKGSKRFWIAVSDGLIRRQQYKRGGSVRTVTYTDLVVNQPVDGAEFVYTPRPGTQVREYDPARPRNERRRRYRVPFAVATDEQRSVAQAHRAQLESLFAEHRRITGRYHDRSEGYGRGVTIDDEGNHIRASETTRGRLVLESPVRFRIELVTDHDRTETQERKCVVADGEHAWRWTNRSIPTDDAVRTVFRDRVVAPGRAFPPAQRAAMLRGDLVTDNGYEVTGDFSVFFVLPPLATVAPDRLVFLGEQVIEGQPVWAFEALETENDRRSEHWIGVNDGVTRRVAVYDHTGTRVDRTMTLTGVQLGADVPASTFAYQPGTHDEVVDEEARRRAKQKKIEAIKRKWGDTVEERFYRSTVATPPFEQAKNVKYDGVSAMSFDLSLRFETDQPVVYKAQNNFKPAGPDEAARAAAWFAAKNPSDKPHLADPDELVCLFDDSDPDGGVWMLSNPRAGVYFFRSWHHW